MAADLVPALADATAGKPKSAAARMIAR